MKIKKSLKDMCRENQTRDKGIYIKNKKKLNHHKLDCLLRA